MPFLRILITYGLLLYPKLALWMVLLLLAFLVPSKFRQKTREAVSEGIGICRVMLENKSKKEENKNRIMELLREKGKLNNLEICEALDISNRTAVRYMDELEKEDKVEQIGETGRAVIYRLK